MTSRIIPYDALGNNKRPNRDRIQFRADVRSNWSDYGIVGTAEAEIVKQYLADPATKDKAVLILPELVGDLIGKIARDRRDSVNTTKWAIIEVAHLYMGWLLRGKCGFNQKRMDGLSDRVRKLVVASFREMDQLGLTMIVSDYEIGVKCITRVFSFDLRCSDSNSVTSDLFLSDLHNSLESIGLHQPNSGVTNRDRILFLPAGDILCGRSLVGGKPLMVLVVDQRVSEVRTACWEESCLVHGWVNGCKNNSEVGAIVSRAIACMVLPEVPENLPIEQRDAYLRTLEGIERAKNAGKAWCFEVRNRFYHPVTCLPKVLRERCKFEIDGKRIPSVQVDIHGTYWAILVSMIKCKIERERLIKLLKEKRFYLALAMACGLPCDGEFKIRCNAQCLFYRFHWDRDKCEIDQGMYRLFPSLWLLIRRLRSAMDVGELSDLLCAGEKSIMEPALIEASKLGPVLVIHDAVMCPATIAEGVRAIIEKHAERVLGFSPVIKIS